jgi:23S rRNA pseudouridine1911/1915/1917 synthase
MSESVLTLDVQTDDEGARLDRFLTARLPRTTRSAVRRWIDEGRVAVEGVPALKPGLGLRGGMRIRVRLPEPPTTTLLRESIQVEVLFEDDMLLVVNKRAGMVVHPGHGCVSGTLVNALLGRGTQLASVGSPDRPGIVHRLDRGTSGVLVVAKTDEAHSRLSEAFASRNVRKRYLALVWGHPPEEGTVDQPIGRSRDSPVKMAVRATRGRTRSATTHYCTLETMPGFSWLEVLPHTGRTHQIRVHMQAIHHPLVGDERYGGRAWRGVQDPLKRKALREFDRLGLHAADLTFPHPRSGESLKIDAPLPQELEQLLVILRQP